MNDWIRERDAAPVLRFFEEISRLPRESGHEEKIADYLVSFAKERGLFCHRDGNHNVLIRLAGSRGREADPPVLLQGHSDMVCEKNADVACDFSHGVKLLCDGKFLYADGTTLGADDGVGVAVMLAVLDGAVPSHPPVECLFTTAEEIGMLGAVAFDYSLIRSRRAINLDNEQFGEVLVGCAGGVRTEVTKKFRTVPAEGSVMRISVSGLTGGHSGVCIGDGLANADKTMARILADLLYRGKAVGDRIRLVSVDGGAKDNVIPRECEAVVAVSSYSAARDAVLATAETLRGELAAKDPNFTVLCERVSTPAQMMTETDTRRTVALMASVANGVFAFDPDIPDLPAFSRNFGIAETKTGSIRGGLIRFVFSTRSADEGQIDASMRELELLGGSMGYTVTHRGRYPGWKRSPDSPLRETYRKTYRALFGKEPTVATIHAGVECGILHSRVEGMDMISIGPDISDIHTPRERLDLQSTDDFWRQIRTLLENL